MPPSRTVEMLALTLAVLLGCKQLSKSESTAAPATPSAPPTASSTPVPPAASAPVDPTATDCGKAVACCKLVAGKAGYKKQDSQCEKFLKYSDARCKAELGQLKQAARVLGLDCKKLWSASP